MALVLSCKPGEPIRIDDAIVIEIVEVRGKNVQVSIDAPKSMKIRRHSDQDSTDRLDIADKAPMIDGINAGQ